MSNAETLRAQYSAAGLARNEVDSDPVAQFKRWFQQASEAGISEPNAMVLATAPATTSGASPPSQRTVLLKDFDENGFVFFTNHGSRKAQHMRENDAVSALFPWYPLHRQVIIEGHIQRVDEDQSRAYFHSRPREAQIGAWASRQSETMASRQVLEERMAQATEKFGDQEIPLPEFWGGYRIRPHRIEFWQGRTHRLHDRILYTRSEDTRWEISRLFP